MAPDSRSLTNDRAVLEHESERCRRSERNDARLAGRDVVHLSHRGLGYDLRRNLGDLSATRRHGVRLALRNSALDDLFVDALGHDAPQKVGVVRGDRVDLVHVDLDLGLLP